ncbi:MAG: hypothetical protein LAP40_10835 [Acidobacteriia bacterium]|nr:hypothetical protein [Terriglobia bacterium]
MTHSICKTALLGGLVVLVCAGLAAGSEVMVVANSSVKASHVDPSSLRDIFLGEKFSLPEGSKVTPVLLKNGPIHRAFLAAYIGKSEAGFQAGWRNMVFTGRGSLLKTFDSEEALLDYVAKTPGAIGYASNTGGRANVKAISVK